MKIKLVVATLMVAALLCAAQQNSEPAKTQESTTGAARTAPAKVTPVITYIRAGKLFDSTSDSYRENVVIVVEGERIKTVAPAAEVQIPTGAKVVDLSKGYRAAWPDRLPHPLGSARRSLQPNQRIQGDAVHARVCGGEECAYHADGGLHTVRDVGSGPFMAVDLRNNINEGYIIGPRVVASGPGITITGGHGDLNNYSPETSVTLFPAERNYQIADGPDQVRHVVRAQVKYGVDVIKILATGGVLSKGDSPGAPQFTYEELKVAADEAHMAGRKIAAHAHGAEGIKNAILAGIDSIEHASLASDEDIQLAKQHGTYFDMDIYNDDYLLGKAIEFGLPQENVDKEKMVGQIQRETFQKAVNAGVKMAFGTDAGVYPHGDNAKQFVTMVKFGMTPAQAIRTATQNSADLIGRSKDVGTIEAGKYADIIAVTGDPLQDVTVLQNVGFVMKGGVVYKDKITGTAVAE